MTVHLTINTARALFGIITFLFMLTFAFGSLPDHKVSGFWDSSRKVIWPLFFGGMLCFFLRGFLM